MKKCLLITVSLIVLVSTLFVPAVYSQETLVLNAGSAWPSSTEIATHFRTTFFSMINEGTNGKIKLKWKSGPSIIAARDLPSSSAAGVIDIFLSSPGYLAGIVKEGAVWDAYPLYRSYESSPKQFEEISELINPIHEEKAKIKILAVNNIHKFYVWTKKPIDSLSQIKGLKLRAHGGFVPYVVKSIGAVPATIPTSEVYMALERGVVDGSARPLTSLSSYKEYEVAKYGIDETITWGTGVIYISLRAWEKLNADLQKDILGICREFNIKTAKYWQNKHDTLRKEFKQQKKVEWYNLTSKERSEWEQKINVGADAGVKALSPTIGPKISEIFKKFAK